MISFNPILTVKHVLYCPIGGVGLWDDPDDDTWLLYRIGVFKNFTLKSLLSQTIKPDLLWLSFDGRRNNPWIEALYGELSTKIPTVITHEGLIYKDDKYILRLRGNERYASSFSYAWRMLGRSVRRRSPKIFIRFVKRLLFKNRMLARRVGRSLAEVRKYLGDFNYVYLTRMDSDDMLHKDWFKELNEHEPRYKQCFIRKNGYVYNANTQELAEWNPKTCPQFFTLCTPRNKLQSGEAFTDYWGDYASHEDASTVFNPVILKDNRYCMLMHGNQISSTWEHPFRGQSVDNKEEMLRKFGVE